MSNEGVDRLGGLLVSAADSLEQEFEARLADSSNLAVRLAFSVLRQREDAEDVAQEAFVRAHRAIGRLRDRTQFRAWIVRITWRLAINKRRGNMRREVRELAAPKPLRAQTSEETLIAGERSARLWRAIDTLPDKFRIVVILAAMEEQGIDDVASLMNIPPGTVKSRLFEARKRLREMLHG